MVLSQELLKKSLYYNPNTGIFTWLYRPHNGIRIGDVAGSTDPDGYVLIRVCGKRYQASRLAFLYITGSWPTTDVDHTDGNPSNNRWSNLREVTTTQNLQNKRIQSNNSSGLKGIHKHKYNGIWQGKWRATINVNKISKHLGLFDSPEEAHQAYMTAAEKYFGVFANSGNVPITRITKKTRQPRKSPLRGPPKEDFLTKQFSLKMEHKFNFPKHRIKKLKRAYVAAKARAKSLHIVWLFTFETWLQTWVDSGYLDKRGTSRGKYVMARGLPVSPDIGPYGPDNVRIIPHEENIAEKLQYVRTPDIRRRISNTLMDKSRPR